MEYGTVMKSLEESVVTAMDGSDKELFPFLPYILQDLWEIGTDPELVIQLKRKRFPGTANLRILDLGCGKGAVSVNVARRLGCCCHGIDAIPEFIEFARQKAREYGVIGCCTFETGDIREMAAQFSGCDVVILGAIGPVFGDYLTTLKTLSPCLSPDGVFIIDDGYIEDNSSFRHPLIQKRGIIRKQIEKAGMELLDEIVVEKETLRKDDRDIFDHLEKRCRELMHQYPDKRPLFLDYIRRQKAENDVLENKIIASVIMIGRKH